MNIRWQNIHELLGERAMEERKGEIGMLRLIRAKSSAENWVKKKSSAMFILVCRWLSTIEQSNIIYTRICTVIFSVSPTKWPAFSIKYFIREWCEFAKSHGENWQNQHKVFWICGNKRQTRREIADDLRFLTGDTQNDTGAFHMTPLRCGVFSAVQAVRVRRHTRIHAHGRVCMRAPYTPDNGNLSLNLRRIFNKIDCNKAKLKCTF